MPTDAQKFLQALEAFEHAADALSEAWESPEVGDDIGTPKYPFKADFRQVTMDISEWTFAVREALK